MIKNRKNPGLLTNYIITSYQVEGLCFDKYFNNAAMRQPMWRGLYITKLVPSDQ
jgi:hypothetical protein